MCASSIFLPGKVMYMDKFQEERFLAFGLVIQSSKPFQLRLSRMNDIQSEHVGE